jgi:hypothetical protein
MIKFEITLGGMLSSIATLRFRQLRWTAAYWARAFGLLPASGKWTERIAFVYIYLLIVGLMTPTLVNLLNGLYVLETKAFPSFRVSIITMIIPVFVALISFLLIVLPWRAWLLRLTFGDITYLASSPFDRRVLSLWRFVEMPLAFGALSLIPFTLLATFLTGGSIYASDVIPTIFRATLAFFLWMIPMLALGWHLSLQAYLHNQLPGSVRFIGRLSVIVAAFVLLVFAPEVLWWPGRLIVLLAHGDAAATWGDQPGLARAVDDARGRRLGDFCAYPAIGFHDLPRSSVAPLDPRRGAHESQSRGRCAAEGDWNPHDPRAHRTVLSSPIWSGFSTGADWIPARRGVDGLAADRQ